MVTGVSLDWHSSHGKRELNPILRGADGRASNARFAAFHLGPTIAGIAVQYGAFRHRKAPKWVIIANFAAGGVMAGIAARNYRISRPR